MEIFGEELLALTGRSDAASRCLNASVDGIFTHPDGSGDPLGDCRIAPTALALIAYLSRNNPTDLSIDVGFGMGSSATMALAARRDRGDAFKHLAFDPWGLGDGRGAVVERYLNEEFGASFERVRKLSEIGLGQLLEERGHGCAGYIFIDGNHSFEQVITDFLLADALCCVGGHIVFDDAHFPAIEAAVEYIRANRDDYATWHLPVVNTSVIRKIRSERPPWYTFRPFKVPQRLDWTPCVEEWNGNLPFARQK